MGRKPSSRIADYVAALPLRPGLRILEVGCGPGAAAREVLSRIGSGTVVAIDRSSKAIRMIEQMAKTDIEKGRLVVHNVAIENYHLKSGEEPFDLAFAMRVGALDGRHPEIEKLAMMRLKAALKPDGLLFIDDRKPIRGDDIDVSTEFSL
ncbi:class I SAM-dependent methyltransferase [Brucella cytisi]|uniref:class I SAM-dependent methyltransferase n=1 Tax=Brucella cytisi TaxID=407152 RepID=UPI0035DFFC9C